MAVMVEKAPTGLQPYLKLMRIDKPIGKKKEQQNQKGMATKKKCTQPQIRAFKRVIYSAV